MLLLYRSSPFPFLSLERGLMSASFICAVKELISHLGLQMAMWTLLGTGRSCLWWRILQQLHWGRWGSSEDLSSWARAEQQHDVGRWLPFSSPWLAAAGKTQQQQNFSRAVPSPGLSGAGLLQAALQQSRAWPCPASLGCGAWPGQPSYLFQSWKQEGFSWAFSFYNVNVTEACSAPTGLSPCLFSERASNWFCQAWRKLLAASLKLSMAGSFTPH